MKKAKLISVLVAAAIVFSGATMITAQALSSGAKGGNSNGSGYAAFANKGRGIVNPLETLESKLQSLVTAGTITQTQADAIKSAIENAKPRNQDRKTERGNRPEKSGPLAELVTAGTITQEQADAVMKAMVQALKESKGSFNFDTVLGGLVTAGTINQTQADAIKTAIGSAKTRNHEWKAERGNRAEKVGPFAALVTSGTITQEQANAVMKAMMEAMKSGKGSFDIDTVLQNLVTAGTINQTQADSIKTAFESAKPQNRNQNRGQSQNAPAYSLKGILDGLVTAGTITQEQETAVINALSPNCKNK